jgi:hypothetical protein
MQYIYGAAVVIPNLVWSDSIPETYFGGD